MIFGYPIFRQIKFIHFHAVPKLTDRTRLTVTGHPLWSSCKHSRVDLENGMEIFHQKKSAPLAQGTADGAQLKKILRSSMSLDTIFCSILDVAAFLCFAPTSLTKTVWIEIMSLMFQANSLGRLLPHLQTQPARHFQTHPLLPTGNAPRNYHRSPWSHLDLTDLHGNPIGTPNHKWCFGRRNSDSPAVPAWRILTDYNGDSLRFFGWLGMSPDGVSEVRPWNYTYLYIYVYCTCMLCNIYLSIYLSLCIYIHIYTHVYFHRFLGILSTQCWKGATLQRAACLPSCLQSAISQNSDGFRVSDSQPTVV